MEVEDPVSGVLQQVTAVAVRLFAAAAASVALVDDEELVYVTASGAGADTIVGTRLPLTRGIAGWAVSAGQPVVVSDVQTDARWARDVAESTGYIPRAIVAAPLQTERDTYGVISVLDPSATGDVAARLLELLALLADQVAVVVELAGVGRADQARGARAELHDVIDGLGDEEVDAVIDIVRAFARYSRR